MAPLYSERIVNKRIMWQDVSRDLEWFFSDPYKNEMKNLLAILAVMLLFTACSPKPQNMLTSCFKGKLVKRGICGQRVIQLLSEPTESIVMARNWTDSMSGKNYENVFTVANPCDFPAAIKEGEDFTFSITTAPGSGCITCYAYTATPGESNSIVSGCKE